jgi:hypothetical protein
MKKETKYLVKENLHYPGGDITIAIDEFTNIEITTQEYQSKTTTWLSGYTGVADFFLKALLKAEEISKDKRNTKE